MSFGESANRVNVFIFGSQLEINLDISKYWMQNWMNHGILCATKQWFSVFEKIKLITNLFTCKVYLLDAVVNTVVAFLHDFTSFCTVWKKDFAI